MQDQQQTAISTGHVYRIDAGQFGIVDYATGDARVHVALLDAETITDAIAELSAKHAGRFVHADKDTESWGRVVFKAQGYGILL
tara:strand:+ start:783 stop:1034 length:252 start_codon:yes stop_codon:yes gene_type:complete